MSPQKKDHSKKTGEKPAAETDHEKSTAAAAKTAAPAKDKLGGDKTAATKGAAAGDKAAKPETGPKSKKSGK
jgi:hypothetical protein